MQTCFGTDAQVLVNRRIDLVITYGRRGRKIGRRLPGTKGCTKLKPRVAIVGFESSYGEWLELSRLIEDIEWAHITPQNRNVEKPLPGRLSPKKRLHQGNFHLGGSGSEQLICSSAQLRCLLGRLPREMVFHLRLQLFSGVV